MKKNMGSFDRFLRLALAVLLLLLGIWLNSWILGIISLFVFYEALAGWCVYYYLIGKTTCPISSSKKTEDAENISKIK